jgi:hypothetical protein
MKKGRRSNRSKKKKKRAQVTNHLDILSLIERGKEMVYKYIGKTTRMGSWMSDML